MRRPAGYRISSARPPRSTGSSSGTCSFSKIICALRQPRSHRRSTETIRGVVAAQPGITLQAVLPHHPGAADAIYALIATAHIYVDLEAVPLAEPARVPLFADRDMALAYAHVHTPPSCTSAHGIALACGTLVSWDGRAWTIGHVGETTVGLRGEGSAWTEVPLPVFETLVRQGKLIGLAPEPTQAQLTVTERLRSAGPAEVREANRRYERLRPFLGEATDTPPGRTVYRWLAAYRQAERLYGNGYVGLLPRTRRSWQSPGQTAGGDARADDAAYCAGV